MRRVCLTLLFITTLLPVPSWAQEETSAYKGEISFLYTNLPTFEKHPLPKNFVKGTLASEIDWASHEDARTYRTHLSEGLKAGPNYAGKYVVVMAGCGTGCQINFVVDTETGKIIDKIETTLGVEYRNDSTLLITNMPEDPYNIDWVNYNYVSPGIEFYDIADGSLKLIDTAYAVTALGVTIKK